MAMFFPKQNKTVKIRIFTSFSPSVRHLSGSTLSLPIFQTNTKNGQKILSSDYALIESSNLDLSL